MIKFYFRKLVGDKVVKRSLVDPKILEIKYRVLEGLEYRAELFRRVSEEVAEIPLEDDFRRDEALGEIADLQNSVDALRKDYGFSEAEVRIVAERKIIKNGGYANKYFVEYVTLADDSEWIEIFRQQPDKYQEEIVQN
ncbi:hypothetical protein EOM60_00040 [Candidatus Saccharibacteria bacterium]|nr:hypothetical protein [Candidatus Saccharibacteria bacterium]